jgi:iron complex transport system ATP-binding protein
LQRVFLARTLAQSPDVILLDEPTNHLDLKHQVELLRYLSDWVKGEGKTAVAVLHDLNLARRFGDAFVLMKGGTIVAKGPAAAVLQDDLLRNAYGLDIARFMRESLRLWEDAALLSG